jgi:4-hydroxythreonine-4-phosphate dehydrogenase
MTLPLIAITMGDPAGIGPEIVARALAEPVVRRACRPVVVGDPRIIARAVAALPELDWLKWRRIEARAITR